MLPPSSHPKLGSARPPLLLLLLLLAVAATASVVRAFLLPQTPASQPLHSHSHSRSPPLLLQLHHGWRRRSTLVPPSTALRAAAAAPGELDTKTLEAWAAQWKADNAKVGRVWLMDG